MARKRRRQTDLRVFMRAFRLFGAVGFNLAGAMFLGFLAGSLLDRVFASAPWLAVTGFLFGAWSGFLRFYRLAMREAHRDSPWDDEEPDEQQKE